MRCCRSEFSALRKNTFTSTRTACIHSIITTCLKKVDDVTIELPLGWKVTNLPKPGRQGRKVAGVHNESG